MERNGKNACSTRIGWMSQYFQCELIFLQVGYSQVHRRYLAGPSLDERSSNDKYTKEAE